MYFGNVFTARKVFIVTAYFNFLYSSLLHYWPLGLSSVSEALISIKRIQEVLALPEQKRQVQEHRAKQAAASKEVHVELEQIMEKDIVPNIIDVKPVKDKRRFVNESTLQKGIVFKNATAGWLRRDSDGSSVGEGTNDF